MHGPNKIRCCEGHREQKTTEYSTEKKCGVCKKIRKGLRTNENIRVREKHDFIGQGYCKRCEATKMKEYAEETEVDPLDELKEELKNKGLLKTEMKDNKEEFFLKLHHEKKNKDTLRDLKQLKTVNDKQGIVLDIAASVATDEQKLQQMRHNVKALEKELGVKNIAVPETVGVREIEDIARTTGILGNQRATQNLTRFLKNSGAYKGPIDGVTKLTKKNDNALDFEYRPVKDGKALLSAQAKCNLSGLRKQFQYDVDKDLFVLHPSQLNQPISPGCLVVKENDRQIMIVRDVTVGPEGRMVSMRPQGEYEVEEEEEEVVNLKKLLMLIPSVSVVAMVDKCTAEHNSYNTGAFSYTNVEEPSSLRHMVFWFSHTGGDKLELTKKLCNHALIDLNEIVVQNKTLTLTIPPIEDRPSFKKISKVSLQDVLHNVSSVCEMCFKTVENDEIMEIHMREHHNSNYKCEKCVNNVTFSNESGFQKHDVLFHQDRTEVPLDHFAPKNYFDDTRSDIKKYVQIKRKIHPLCLIGLPQRDIKIMKLTKESQEEETDELIEELISSEDESDS